MKHFKTLLCAAVFAAFAIPSATAAARGAEGAATETTAKAKSKTKAKAKAKAKSKSKSKTKVKAKSKTKAKSAARVKSYDFLGDNLEGDLVSPDMDNVVGRVAATHTSLIKVRMDFVREIGKAAENL
jgi:hypothetical protein